MLTVLQRVSKARVEVSEQVVGSIEQGLLVLCGFEPQDNEKTLLKMLDKCLHYRIFSDADGKMNLSLKDVQGGLLLVPQFTLMAETKNGLRPSFSKAAPPEQGKELFQQLMTLANNTYSKTRQGVFGADMQVHLCNDGPVTFLMNF